MAQTAQININLNAKQAQSEFDNLRKNLSVANKELESLIKTYGENSKQADKQRKVIAGLSLEYDKLNKEFTDLGATFEDVAGEMKPLTGRLGEIEDRLYELSLAGEAGTKTFNDLVAEAGRMRQTIIETDRQVDAAALTLDQKLGGALMGITSTFAIAQGAMGIFGAESENVEKALLKVQSAVALLQGFKELKEAAPIFKGIATQVLKTQAGQMALNAAMKVYAVVTKAMTAVQWAFNAALNANPIGAIVIAITALIAAGYALIKLFSWFTEDTISAAEANEQLNASIEKQNALFEDNANKIRKNAENRRRLLEISGASEEQLHQDTLRRLKEEEDLRKEELTNVKDRLKERRELYKQAKEEEDDDTARAIKEEIQKDKERYKELELNNKEYNIAVKEENKRYQEEKLKEEQKAAEEEERKRREAIDKYKQYLQNRLSAERQIQDLELSLMKEGLDKQLEENRLNFDRLVEDTKSNTNLTQKEKEKIISLYEKQRKDKEDKIRKDFLDAEKEKLDKQNQQIKAAQDEWAQQEEDFYAEYEQNTLSAQELEVRAVQDKYFRLIELAKQYGLDTTELERRQQEEINKINKEYEDERIANTKTSVQKFAENALEVIDTWGSQVLAVGQAVADAFNVIAENQLAQIEQSYNEEATAQEQMLANGLINRQEYDDNLEQLERSRMEKEKAIKRKQFQIDKANRIAEAIMSGAQSVLSALTIPPPVGTIMAAINGALAATQVGIIAAQQFKAARGGIVPGNGPGNVDSVPSLLAPGEAVINANSAAMFPNLLSMVNQAGGGQPLVPDTANIGSGSAGSGTIFTENKQQSPLKAYVVESEMTSAQKRVNKIERAVEY